MRCRWTLAALLLVLFLTAAPSARPARAGAGARLFTAPGEVLVAYRIGATARDAGRVEQGVGAVAARFVGRTGVRRLRLAGSVSTEDALRALGADPAVAHAQPNYLYYPAAVPNDPWCAGGSQWGLHNYGQEGGTPGADVHAPQAWDLTTGSANVAVAVIDSGIDYTHPDLAPNIWTNAGEIPGNRIDDDGNGYVDDVHGWNAVDNNGDPMDHMGHGTHCAGTIGALGNNGMGVAGINWSVRIIATRFIGGSGFGSTADAIECLDYIHTLKDRGVNVIATNNSWSGGGDDPLLNAAIEASNARGILFITASGNGSASGAAVDTETLPIYPGCLSHPNIINVTATDRKDRKAAWANYGRTGVHLGAPGVEVWSTVLGGSYDSDTGTSMAAPHVTGAAALLAAYDPSLTHLQIKDRLLRTGDPLPDLAGRTVSGRRLNLYNALTNTVPAAATTPALTVGVRANKSIYRLGETMRITVTVAEGGNPVSRASVRVVLRSPNGGTITRTGSTQRGTSQLTFPTRRADGRGTYTLTATVTKSGYAAGTASLSVSGR